MFIKGYENHSSMFSFVVRNDEARAEFVQNVVRLVKEIRFDGVDIHWEYPG